MGHTDASTGLVALMRAVSRLKRTARTGWLHRGVPSAEVESVADHSYGVALLAWLAASAEPTLNRARVLELALIHDLAEAVTGDQAPYAAEAIPANAEAAARFLNQRHLPDKERRVAKLAAEAQAMEELVAGLPNPLRTELLDRWREYAARQTPEARFVKEVDRLETYLQSRAYLAEDRERPMDAFAQEVAEELTTPILRAIRDEAS
jgi:putative hydrolase of HD superfamily